MFSFLERPIKSLPLILLHVFIYLGLMVILFVAYQYLTGQQIPLPQPNVDWWDVGHYYYVVVNGYSVDPMRTAFYPLFPYLWRWSGLDMLGISIANGVLFITGFSLLMKELQPTVAFLWAILTLPFTFFYFIPYTESLFFFITTFLILGIRREKPLWIILALFFSCLARPTSQVYIPAILLTAYLTFPTASPEKRLLFNRKKVIAYLSAAMLGQGIVMGIHTYQTGNPFAFYEAQKNWNHKLQMFKLPIVSWSNDIVFTDANFFYVGFVAVMISSILLYRHIKKNHPKHANFAHRFQDLWHHIINEPFILFSVLYLAGITGLIILFQGGDVHSFSRYLTCNPFFIVYIGAVLPFFRLQRLQYLYFFIGFMIVGLATMFVFHHIQATKNFAILTSYWIVVALTNEKGIFQKIGYVMLMCFHLILSVVFTSMFFHRVWVQ